MRKILLLACLLIVSIPLYSQENRAYYRVSLRDKTGTQYSLSHPEAFLSPEALARRMRFNIAVEESDLPVSQRYLDSLEATGFKVVHTSKWNNTVTVASLNGDALEELRSFSFAESVQLTKPLLLTKSTFNKLESVSMRIKSMPTDNIEYGNGWKQIHQLRGELLHEKVFKGAGIRIAVIDAGFANVDTLSAFQALREKNRLLGTRDFVNPRGNVFEEHNHGTNVLSVMAANLPGRLVGSAPEASYWLIRSEDDATEYPVEEDNWVAALEYADSLGADLVNSSLGYFVFDNPAMNHSYSELDGYSTLITRAATMAVHKGIFLVNSAGNEGNKSWRKIILPADSEVVLTVGAVDSTGQKADFSSFGPSASGEIKPNVMARGKETWLIKKDGTLATSSGTSFSAPLMTGILACLMQAFPQKNLVELKAMIEQTGHQFTNPDTLMGYGIPNLELLFTTGNKFNSDDHIRIYPTIFHHQINILTNEPVKRISLFNLQGNLLLKNEGYEIETGLSGLENLPGGIYILEIKLENRIIRKKVVKSKSGTPVPM